MRKKLIIYLCLLLCSNIHGVEFKRTELQATSLISDEKISASCGGKIVFDIGELRLYRTMQKTEFSKIHSLQDIINSSTKNRWGMMLRLQDFSIPACIKIGNNTFSKSISKLKTPSPSTTMSPLTKSFGLNPGTGANLTSLTTSWQPVSADTSFEYDSQTFNMKLQVGITEEMNTFASAATTFKHGKTSSLTTALTAGRFSIENHTAALKKASADFDEQWQMSILGEVFLKTPLLRCVFQGALLQTPYNQNNLLPFNAWIRFSPTIYLKNFLFNFTYFLLPLSHRQPAAAPLVGGSSSVCRTLEQFSFNPQFVLMINDRKASTIRIGLQALDSIKITATKNPVTLQVAKVCGAAEYQNSFSDLTLELAASNILVSGTPPDKSSTPEKTYSAALKSAFLFCRNRIDMDLSLKHIPPATKTASSKASFLAKSSICPSFYKNACASVSYEITTKNGSLDSQTSGASLVLKKDFGPVRTNFKVGIEMKSIFY